MKKNTKDILVALNVTALILSGSLPVMAGNKPQETTVSEADITQPANQANPSTSNLQNSDKMGNVKKRIPKMQEKVGAGYCGAGKCGGGESLKKTDIPLPKAEGK